MAESLRSFVEDIAKRFGGCGCEQGPRYHPERACLGCRARMTLYDDDRTKGGPVDDAITEIRRGIAEEEQAHQRSLLALRRATESLAEAHGKDKAWIGARIDEVTAILQEGSG
jgi:hypothetical protein